MLDTAFSAHEEADPDAIYCGVFDPSWRSMAPAAQQVRTVMEGRAALGGAAWHYTSAVRIGQQWRGGPWVCCAFRALEQGRDHCQQ